VPSPGGLGGDAQGAAAQAVAVTLAVTP
jgi:hypothetical protein